MHKSGVEPKLQNLVATVNFGCKVDLKTIALRARNAEYNPKVSWQHPHPAVLAGGLQGRGWQSSGRCNGHRLLTLAAPDFSRAIVHQANGHSVLQRCFAAVVTTVGFWGVKSCSQIYA